MKMFNKCSIFTILDNWTKSIILAASRSIPANGQLLDFGKMSQNSVF